MNLVKQNNLTKKEKNVLRVVYNATDKNSVCLLTPIEIFSALPLDLDYEEDDLDTILRDLEIDDYFDVTRSDKKGELVYCINMHQKGLSYARVERAFRSNIMFRLLLALATGTCSTIIGLLIKFVIVPLFQ
ncbi:MAG: hypothetical protein MJ193_01560 [Clostridia bacterium]|nr:hypothetical protein [Clostridia bacterium]